MQTKNQIPVYINYSSERFLQTYKLFKLFLENVPFELLNKKKKTPGQLAGIIISPRNNSGIPWCNLAIALLYRALGHSVKLLWDDLPFLDPEWDTQNTAVGELVLFICRNTDIRFVKLSEFSETDIDESDLREIRRLSLANGVWNVRNVVPTAELERYINLSEQTMIVNSRKIKTMYKTEKVSFCLHQSLINNNGGLHKWFGNKNNIRVSSFDISCGCGKTGLNNIPGYSEELPQLIDENSEFYLFDDPETINMAIDIAKHEHELRRLGKDVKQSQIITVEQDLSESRPDIILPLNILWDAAALIRNRFFSTPYNWIIETVDFILLQTEATVAVRQHPHERQFERYATGTRLGESLQEKFGNNPRFIFYSSNDQVNSYRLVEQSKVVLPYTSTLGIEAALMGKHVIMESSVYYVDQPFVTKAKSKEDYFNKIKEALKTTPTATAGSVSEKGWLLYYLHNKCIQVYSPFGLDPADFDNWVPLGFERLLNDENLIVALDSLAKNIPFGYVNGKKLLEQITLRNRSIITFPAGREDKIKENLAEMLSHINRKDYQSALELSEQVEVNDKTFFLYPQAFALAKLNRNEEAVKFLKELIDKKPDHVYGNLLLNELNVLI